MKNKRKFINWSLLIFWMIIIFIMSNQPGQVSSGQSDLLIKLISLIGLDLNSSLGDIASLVVRKVAHFTEYFILFVFVINVAKCYFEIKKSRLISIFVVLLYAITDEIHQFFIPGREMAILDILIDFSGGVFALIINIIYQRIQKYKLRR